MPSISKDRETSDQLACLLCSFTLGPRLVVMLVRVAILPVFSMHGVTLNSGARSPLANSAVKSHDEPELYLTRCCSEHV